MQRTAIESCPGAMQLEVGMLACSGLESLPEELFFHFSELPHQLCVNEKIACADVCGKDVDFLVVKANGAQDRLKAVRLALLEPMQATRGRKRECMRSAKAIARRDQRFLFQAGVADPYEAEQQSLLTFSDPESDP